MRIRAEERQLTDSLGEEYQRYAASHKRLVPRGVVKARESGRRAGLPCVRAAVTLGVWQNSTPG